MFPSIVEANETEPTAEEDGTLWYTERSDCVRYIKTMTQQVSDLATENGQLEAQIADLTERLKHDR